MLFIRYTYANKRLHCHVRVRNYFTNRTPEKKKNSSKYFSLVVNVSVFVLYNLYFTPTFLQVSVWNFSSTPGNYNDVNLHVCLYFKVH